jgi:hypothetical protein
MAGSRSCPICRGLKVVRHVAFEETPANAFEFTKSPKPTTSAAYREYPCPECSMGDFVPVEKLWVMEEFQRYDLMASQWGGRDFEEHVKRALVQRMMHQILASDAVTYVDGPPSRSLDPYTAEKRATLSVVPARFTKSLEDRVRERQTVVADRAVRIAEPEINSFGGNTSHIPKTVAIATMRNAVKRAIDDFFSRGALDR